MRYINLTLVFLIIHGMVISQTDYNQQLEKAAISIANKIKATGKKNIAVLDFENSNKQISELGSWLSGVFTTHLENNSGGAFSVKNNTDVVKAIQQIKTESGSGAFDSRSIQRLGEISGSDVVIYGIITLMDNDITVNIKAVNPSAGNQTPIGGNLVSFYATDGMRTKYDNFLEDKPSSPTGSQQASGSASGEGTARTSKNPNCKENNTGDICFNNLLKIKVQVRVYTPGRYGVSLTLDPNQTQCFYDLYSGNYSYNINKGTSSGYYGNISYDVGNGQIYIEQCKSKTFTIK